MSGRLFIGVMSGTSLDGADAVVAEFPAASSPGTAPGHRVLAHRHAPFPGALRATLLALQQSGPDELHRAALAAHALADHYATLIDLLLRQTGLAAGEVIAVGAHGQTVRHRPELGYTLQLNAPARLAEACGIDVIADFRSRDIAAGGQGAPLVPAFHADLFGSAPAGRVVVNIGGIGNVTHLPASSRGSLAAASANSSAPTISVHAAVRGWDTGPGNVLLDGWIHRHRGQAYDVGGAWAASGSVIEPLLELLLADPWFERAPPKSTGRDLFNADWLDLRLVEYPDAKPEDVQATLAECTARSIAAALAAHCPDVMEVIVCGGGAFNADLLARLSRNVNAGAVVVTSAAKGVPPDQVEALAFAWLAHRHVAGLSGNLPAVTGASGPRILGSRTPR